MVGDSTASETTGCWFSWSARMTSGSFTSLGKPGFTAAILSRTSCNARLTSVARPNSAKISLRPSSEVERIVRTPDTVLIAYSSGLVTSVSPTSGEAPG